VLSGLLLLIPRLFYTYVASPIATPALDFGLGDLVTRLVETAPSVYLSFGQFYGLQQPFVNLAVGLALLVTFVLSTRAAIRSRPRKSAESDSRSSHIYLASLWFLVFGPLPYILLGYDVVGRVYSSAVFGVFPLVLLIYETADNKWLLSVALAILGLFAFVGGLTLWNESQLFSRWEAPLNMFYRGIKEEVPHVADQAAFIIINSPIGNQGCKYSLQMLYGLEDVDCLVIASGAEQGSFRRPGEFQSSGLTLLEDDWIIINVVDNVPTIVDELSAGDYELLIDWEINEPMHTSRRRIVTNGIPAPTQFYLHLLERAKILSASQ
jgi:hypothetical protein